MDAAATQAFVDRAWDESIVPELIEYIKIPNKSPAFDADWEAHGYMEEAVSLITRWCRENALPGMSLEVVRLAGRTPLIYMDVPGEGEGCVLLYGHLDKQPEMHGWREDLGPWVPVLEGDRLYGRGGADDGYAAYASLAALQAMREQGVPHARCVILIEACEESGSYDLPFYIDALAGRIGNPDLVICLDSGCGNYDQLWCTTSLRGMTAGDLSIEVLSEGVHSGDAGGIVPSTFRVLRELLGRLENESSGQIIPGAFHAEIPEQRVQQAARCAEVLGEEVYCKFPFLEGVKPVATDSTELVLNRTWRPAVEVTGAAGIPPIEDAGNVARPATVVRLSMRLPPTLDSNAACEELARLLTSDPPYGARVGFTPAAYADGWNAPPLADWLATSVDAASLDYFGRDAVYMGEGGTIPFMGMLGEKFPDAQFLITGVLGPASNAHGPNEFLHIPTGKRITCCVAQVVEDHYRVRNGT